MDKAGVGIRKIQWGDRKKLWCLCFGKQEEDKPIKVDKWDGNAVKNVLDDAAKKVLTDKLGFKESNMLMDGRLLICTIAVGFAGFALIWDYFNPFPKSKPILIVCVLSYFVMMGLLTLYTTYRERGCFLLALDKDLAGIDPDNVWRLSSQLKRYDHVYHLTVTYLDGESKEERRATLERSVANYFDEKGQLCSDLFEPEVKNLAQSLTTDKKEK